MLVAFLLMTAAPDWVPARWQSSDPKSLELIAQTPINCLLLERGNWAAAFNKRAADRGIATLGVVRTGPDALEQARQAVSLDSPGGGSKAISIQRSEPRWATPRASLSSCPHAPASGLATSPRR